MLNTPVYRDHTGEQYKDKKRLLWLGSTLIPVIILIGPLAYMLTELVWTLWAPIVMFYGIVPFIDLFLGEDESNPPESIVKDLEKERYYTYVTYLATLCVMACFVFCAWFVSTYDLPWHGLLAVGLAAGMMSGYAINIGHEMGHKKDKLDIMMAKIALSIGAYGHFFVEHNYGHHRDVATPEDPASSRMGESIYRFVLREMPGGFIRAWQTEKQRLNRQQKSAWSLDNQVLQPLMITAIIWGSLLLSFGWVMVPFLIITFFWGGFVLTSANYIEHYGLLRQKDAQGRYERCQPHHSWNSNHIFSNWISFHLQRHSDHHANPARRYQSLRHFDEAPALPNGYFGMFMMAYVPPIWFVVMDQRLVDLVGNETSKLNISPKHRAKMIKKYSLIDNG